MTKLVSRNCTAISAVFVMALCPWLHSDAQLHTFSRIEITVDRGLDGLEFSFFKIDQSYGRNQKIPAKVYYLTVEAASDKRVVWTIETRTDTAPPSKFKYGQVPEKFKQISPLGYPPPSLTSKEQYTVTALEIEGGTGVLAFTIN